MESQGISFINYQLRAGIAACLSLFPIPFSLRALSAPCLLPVRREGGRGQRGHMVAETVGRRSHKLFVRPPSSPSSKNPGHGPWPSPLPPPAAPQIPHFPGRERANPTQQSGMTHRVPSTLTNSSPHGEPGHGGDTPPAAGGAGAGPEDKAALGNHVFPQETQRWVERLQMSTAGLRIVQVLALSHMVLLPPMSAGSSPFPAQ